VSTQRLSVGIIGGGIGGLGAALSLLRAGFDAHVYERTAVLREVGAGIQVSPNASRVLHGLGMADELARMGVRPLAFHQRRWDDGRTLLRTPLGDAVVEAFGFPHYQMHRADLLDALVRALPEGHIHLAHRLVAISEDGDRVEARFENGKKEKYDLLVGADGIHSTVRTILLGPEEPRFTGCVAYRGLVPAGRLKHLNLEVTAQIWMGPGAHFVHYFVQDCRLLNVVAAVEQDTWTRESWTDRGEVGDWIAAFEGWHPQLHELLRALDETFIWALFDRAPLERWSTAPIKPRETLSWRVDRPTSRSRPSSGSMRTMRPTWEARADLAGFPRDGCNSGRGSIAVRARLPWKQQGRRLRHLRPRESRDT
jgi:salicylate hydroxylase